MALISISNIHTCQSAKDWFVFLMVENFVIGFSLLYQLHYSTPTKLFAHDLKQMDFSNNHAQHQIRKVT